MSLTVKIKTLTPLWTGGVDGTMDRIHETGILGSLRWWYEAIVRGLGGSACDPTSDERCPDKNGRYCDVCAVFGATGLQRAFRLEGPEWWNNRRQDRLTVKVNNNRGWYLGHGYLGEGTLRIVPLRVPAGLTWNDVKQTLLWTLRLIEHWGGLGPKTQVGYGVVDFDKLDAVTVMAFQKLKQISKRRTFPQNTRWSSLEGFFFAKARFTFNTNPEKWIRKSSKIEPDNELDWYLNKANDAQRKAVLPLAPIVRYHLRSLVRQKIQYNGHPNAPARWELLGVLNGYWHKDDYGKVSKHNNQWQCKHCENTWKTLPSGQVERYERKSSLIHVSHAYSLNDGQWEFRIWGWIPKDLPGEVTRDSVLKRLRQWLGISKNASQQRQWHPAQNGQLWQNINISDPKVCWFEQETNEKTVNFIHALLNACECEKEATP